MFRNILVAIDGSAHAQRALTEAVDLAQRTNARLTVMTVAPDPSTWVLSAPGYMAGVDFERLAQEADREYGQLLDDALESVRQDVSVTKVLAHGRAGERILAQVETGSHDLVVMGSRGRGQMRSLLLGSVSHEVLNASAAAVLIVHAAEDAAPS
jgi:nucleotide-binding universal stress UspA family protein